MTAILVDLRTPAADGAVPTTGHARFVPLERRVEGGWIVIPGSFSMPLFPPPVVQLAPGYWQIEENTTPYHVRHVTVPDVPAPTVLPYGLLVDVDPATLVPSESAVPAWTAAVGQVQAATAIATGAATSATGSASAAAASAGAAEQSRAAMGAIETAIATGLTAEDGAVSLLMGNPASTTREATTALIAAETPTINAARYGASPTATWQTNRAAFQAANDAAKAAGGGVITAKPGIYTVAGIIQDARVEIHGPGVTLRHPTGDGADIIRARTHFTTGTITKGSDSLTVASTAGIEVGAVIGIRGAGGHSSIQWTTLAQPITADQTAGIAVASATGLPSPGFLVVDDEIISYTAITGATLTGVTRGTHGTAPAAHAAAARIGTAMRLLGEVTAITGTTLTLDRAATVTVTASPVQAGILSPRITNLRLDGNRPVGGATTTNPIRWDMVRHGTIRDVDINRGESAFYLAQGTRDCLIDGITAHDCSVPEASKGSVFWLFQQCHRNTLVNLTVTGDMWSGVYLDNRTSLATEWDGSCDDNQGGGWTFVVTPHTPWITNTALNIVGSSRNTFSGITTRNVRTGFLIEDTTQVHTGDGSMPGATGNHVDRLKMVAGFQPYIIHTPGNLVTALTYQSAANGANPGGSLIMSSAVAPGGAPVIGQFPDGTQGAPGVAFGSEPNTGFYKIAAGQVQFVALAQLIMRLRTNGILMGDGKNFEFTGATGSMMGTGATQKLGFWGKTPTVRPSAIPDSNAADLAALEAEVNKLKALLRAIGLMG